ncbi:fucolectin-like [Patiria miniata]|uniref:Fucolectin tachylectin-4 pentraxin-1 domain-containing protein n=1 Tax=Patiria miniata TaxID=46514 RepID=A0A914ABV2_PATMI|nr:fucolectin-like [Patiria miniata]
MLRLLLLTLALCHAVFAFPQNANTEEELTRDLELLERALERKFMQDETEPEGESKRQPQDGKVLSPVEHDPPVTLVDIAKPQTEQSSTLNFRGVDYVSGNAVDGNFNSALINGGTCAHTETERHPWWKLHLHESHCIAQVGIVNRRDGSYVRLAGAEVLVGGIHRLERCGSPVSAESANIPGGMNLVICVPPIRGDEIVIGIPRDEATLQICEVLLWEVSTCE